MPTIPSLFLTLLILAVAVTMTKSAKQQPRHPSSKILLLMICPLLEITIKQEMKMLSSE
jgi:hypothetical protein